MKKITIKRKNIKRIITILSVAIILLLILLIATPFFIMSSFTGQRFEQQQYNSLDFNIPSEQIELITKDHLKLAAWRTQVDSPKGTIIILSGIQNPSVTYFFPYAKLFADDGWDSLLIEMRGRSLSEGEETGLGMTEWQDVIAGVDFLSSDPNLSNLPIIAMGTSLGASASIIATGEDPRIDGTIAVSAFSDWIGEMVDQMYLMGVPKWLATLEKPFLNLYLGLHYNFDSLQYTPIRSLEKFNNRPLLLMHSTKDSQVPYSNFERLVEKATKENLIFTPFVREGDHHFVIYDEYSETPEKDVDFSQVILFFLNNNFSHKKLAPEIGTDPLK